MKYICRSCYNLCDEPFARDGEGYFCSRECYDEEYPDNEPEDLEDAIPVNLTAPEKKWWHHKEG